MSAIHHELRLFGHRGASALRPENTMAAFRLALDDGANALELDVHSTADRHLVVAHDPDGRRMAGTSARICDLELRDVKSWDLTSDCSGSDVLHTVPTLDEVLAAFPDIHVSVDLKPNDPRAAEELVDLVAAHRADQRVTIGSFHDRLVHLVRRLGYPGPTALTRGEVAAARLLPAAMARRRVAGQAAMIPRRRYGVRLDDRRFIARCRQLGLRVDYWVVNDPGVARALLKAGATGLVSDNPGAIASVAADFGLCQ
jgi:glycerophosphoryl diester phosphodiesterase